MFLPLHFSVENFWFLGLDSDGEAGLGEGGGCDLRQCMCVCVCVCMYVSGWFNDRSPGRG
jgi:hypothetical protein